MFAGTYAQAAGGAGDIQLIIAIVLIAIIFLYAALKVVKEYERLVVFRLGHLIGSKGPGLILLIPIIDRFARVSLRIITLDVPTQEVITKDNVTCSVNAVVYYRVVNSDNAVVNVENYREATAQLAQTTLRSVAGQAELDELLAERDKLNQKIQQILDEATDAWGIKVTAVEIKDVVIPEGLQRAISRQASAERERRAVIIQADGERQAAQRLAQSASILSSQPGGFFVRLMRILPEISYQQGNVIAFPLPMELRHLFDAFDGKGGKEGGTPPPEGNEEVGSEEDLTFGGEGFEPEGEEGLPPDDTEDENF